MLEHLKDSFLGRGIPILLFILILFISSKLFYTFQIIMFRNLQSRSVEINEARSRIRLLEKENAKQEKEVSYF